ncbi:MAG: Uma2 family endonuclease [Fimbriiglobus sp.]
MNAASLEPTSTTPPPTPARMTAEEFFAKHENDRVELVRGVVKEIPPMPLSLHGYVCSLMGFFLTQFVRENNLGRVFSNDSFVKVSQDTVYGPDVVYVSYTLLAPGKLPNTFLNFIPELVVEVRSPSNTWTQLLEKTGDYLDAGVTAVVLVNTDLEALSVYRAGFSQEDLSINDDLTLPDILPGFTLPVRKLFE